MTDASEPRIPGPGESLSGAYQIEEVLGAGGMGVVLRAKDVRLDRDVAIKTMRLDRMVGAEARARFLTEARALARVTHPNVVQVHSFGEHEGLPFFVMEYVKGRTLAGLIADGTFARRPLGATIDVLEGICNGLTAIHTAGLVHGDVKPENVLVSRGGRVVLADMGLARLCAKVTSDGTVWGTVDYMAPEVIRGEPLPPALAARSDVYSLGCLVFEMLTGRPPFVHDRDVGVMEMHLREPPPRASEVDRRVPPALDAVIAKTLEKRAAARTATPEDVCNAMRRALRISHRGRPVILIVDDHADQRALLAEYLGRVFSEAEILAVSDGEHALHVLEQHVPAVAIVDLDMPRLNGLELVACMRGRKRTRNVPTIMLTGTGSSADWQTVQQLGVSRFFVKPAAPAHIASSIRDIFQDEARD